jgi:hypothetical protein
MLKDWKRNIREQNKISKPLKRLELRQETDTWTWFPGPLLRPDQFHEVRRINLVEFLGGRSSLQLRISRVADAGHD